MIIGVSGKIGTGKSHVAKFLRKKLGFNIIQSEKIRNKILETPEIRENLVNTFGKKILHPNGKINKERLMLALTQEKLNYDVFQQLIEPLVGKEIRRIVQENEDNYIIDVTMPDKYRITNFFDVSVLVTTPKMVAFRRVRNRLPHRALTNLWTWQKDTRIYDYVIENKTSIGDLKSDVDELISEMFKNKNLNEV